MFARTNEERRYGDGALVWLWMHMNMMRIVMMSDCEVKTLQLFGMVKCDMFARRTEGWGYGDGVVVWLWL